MTDELTVVFKADGPLFSGEDVTFLHVIGIVTNSRDFIVTTADGRIYSRHTFPRREVASLNWKKEART